MKRTFLACDLFCGAGGTSAGLLKAAKLLGWRLILTAVNHWQTAINSHSLNHPGVRHIRSLVENLSPRQLFPGGFLDLLVASCECIFHSNARGGGPCNEQSRSQAWQIIRWATDLTIASIMMENVPEFRHWGPLHPRTHRPIKSRRGEYFRAFVKALEDVGYVVEWKIQNAADFGDPTNRRRLILIARLKSKVSWPRQSHFDPEKFPTTRTPWKSARQCIDRSLQGKSIFNADGTFRHCKNTMRRIEKGLEKFGGPNAEPFLLMLRGTSNGHINSCARSLDRPMPAVTASGNHHLLVEPIIVQTDNQSCNGIMAQPLDRPFRTLVSKQNMLLVEPKIEFITKYYGSGISKSIDQPLDTLTAKDRFMLVQTVEHEVRRDVHTRMFQPHEQAAAHSFPPNYKFTGSKRDQTKQIGNSVPVELAKKHALAVMRSMINPRN